MKTHRNRWQVIEVSVAGFCLFLSAFSAMAIKPILSVPLDGQTDPQGAVAQVDLGAGAHYVPSAEGQGVAPGDGAPALTVSPAGHFWKDRGTLAFRFRVSREVRGTNLPGLKRAGKTVLKLVESPVANIAIHEQGRGSRLILRIPGDPRTTKRPGAVNVTFLKPDRWYHLALAWDAKAKQVTAFLNGTDVGDLFHWNNAPMEITPKSIGRTLLGGQFGKGNDAVSVSIDEVRVYRNPLTESDWKTILAGRHVPEVDGETRTVREGTLDLSPYRKTLLYEADFTKPLSVVCEDDLFQDGKRVKTPGDAEWVMEGPGRATVSDGILTMESLKPEDKGHIVLWNTRAFPADLLVEYDFSPSRDLGLHILFFSATNLHGGSIFEPGLPKRGGVFKNYIAGQLNSYHVSLFAADDTKPRRSANLRKNANFYLVGAGTDNIAGAGAGPHHVRLLKVGGKIRVETAGKMALAFDDDGKTYGPIWGEGLIGLRLMGHTHKAAFRNLKVYAISRRLKP